MPLERFQRLNGDLDTRLAPARRQAYEDALTIFHVDVMITDPVYGSAPRFNPPARRHPDVSNIVCQHQYYFSPGVNEAYADVPSNGSHGDDKMGCGSSKRNAGQFYGNHCPRCNFKESDLRIDTAKGEVVARFECNAYACEYFNPIAAVLAIAKPQLDFYRERIRERNGRKARRNEARRQNRREKTLREMEIYFGERFSSEKYANLG